MKKIFSSAFILLLLLISLWGVSAWYFGTKTEQLITTLYQNENQLKNQIFDYEVLEYDRSIFSSKVKIGIELNPLNPIAQLILEVSSTENQQLTSNIEVHHGPIFLNKKGVSLGSSAWKLDFDQRSIKNRDLYLSNKVILNQLPKLLITVDFEDLIEYQTSVIASANKIQLNGNYDLKTATHKGIVSSSQLLFRGDKQTVQTSRAEIHYQQLKLDNNGKTRIHLSAKIPEFSYSHSSLDKKIKTQITYQGELSLENKELTHDGKLLIDFDNNTHHAIYPIDKGELLLKFKALNIVDLLKLNNAYNQLKNLQQQSQWILEEQGELPEGQDQIWQVQDKATTYAQQLPKLMRKVLVNYDKNDINHNTKDNIDEKSLKLKFFFQSEFRNKLSKLSGAIYPVAIKEIDGFSDTSLFSLTQAQAQISLDDQWLQFLVTRLPIKKKNFKLIYQKNKLLMQ